MWGLDALTPMQSKIHIELYSQPSLSGGSNDNESGRSAVDLGPIPGLGRSPRERKGYPLQYYGLENSSPWGCKESHTIELYNFHFLSLYLRVHIHEFM